MKDLTHKQRQLVATIEVFKTERGRAPTQRELAGLLGMKQQGVHSMLKRIAKREAAA
jgi:DNA-binding MarR family transcriptional regulator